MSSKNCFYRRQSRTAHSHVAYFWTARQLLNRWLNIFWFARAFFRSFVFSILAPLLSVPHTHVCLCLFLPRTHLFLPRVLLRVRVDFPVGTASHVMRSSFARLDIISHRRRSHDMLSRQLESDETK